MIARAVQQSGQLRVEALAALTGVSAVTIRRDLVDLEARGAVRRSAGVALRVLAAGEPIPFGQRFAADQARKEALAEVVAEQIADYESVILDNGTSVYAVALRLAGRPITAMPLSLHAAVALGARPGAHVIVPGGPVEPDSLALLGSQTVDAVRAMRADVLVLGACAISADGELLAEHYEDALVKKAALESARRVILVATGDKADRPANFRFGTAADIDAVVTTPDMSPQAIAALRAAGVEVRLVAR